MRCGGRTSHGSFMVRCISEEPSIEFSDKILYLRALNAARSPDYDRWLSQLERSGFETPQFAIELAKWKLSALGPQSAADWLERAPDQVRRQPSVNLLLAECYSALGRWADLETLTNSGPWRDYEVLCLAYLARGQAGQGNLAGSEQTWNLALAAAESSRNNWICCSLLRGPTRKTSGRSYG
jgi:hypothetical protein